MKYSYHPLPQSYIDILQTRKHFSLVIVGKDPFPTAPTGVPFCKPSWNEQNKRNGSGIFVLESIGIDVASAMEAYSVPVGLFYSLAIQGVVFLNCSYHFLETDGLPKKDYKYVESALITNEPVIRNADNVILCGESKILSEKIDGIDFFLPVVHPDPRNRKKDEWAEIWGKDKLTERFNLNLRS